MTLQEELQIIRNSLQDISKNEGFSVTMKDWERSVLKCDESSMSVLDQHITKSRDGTLFRIQFKDLTGQQYFCLVPKVRYYERIIHTGVHNLNHPYVEMCRGHWRIRDGHHRIQALSRLGRQSAVVRVFA